MTDSTASGSPGERRQLEIYKAGLVGKTPSQPVSVDELEDKARSVLDREAFDYLAGGAGAEETMLANRVAMGPGLAPPRFLWVSYVDALLFPLSNKAESAATPDRAMRPGMSCPPTTNGLPAS